MLFHTHTTNCLRRGAIRLPALALALALAIGAGAATAASIDGEATYRERIAPPADAVLVVTLEDSARADAPATEIASTRMRIAGGPPYRWRIEYDERLIGPQARPMLRARLETPQGLSMTTDTANPAFTEPRLLVLRSVRASVADGCSASATTQAALGECAYEEFLTASAALSAQLQRIESSLPAQRKAGWRRVQKSWLTYRTDACSFESGSSAGGSVQPMLQWHCAARLTRARAAELAQAANCPEGELTCARPAR